MSTCMIIDYLSDLRSICKSLIWKIMVQGLDPYFSVAASATDHLEL